MNCFFLFCRDHRAETQTQHADIGNSELTSILGQMWRDLPQQKKQYYKQRVKDEPATPRIDPVATENKKKMRKLMHHFRKQESCVNQRRVSEVHSVNPSQLKKLISKPDVRPRLPSYDQLVKSIEPTEDT
eukprot:CAMPEP_0206189260 /NCGR_PEP_ID=MMETSP0166-20121206/4071_1 /ASSEMBLY_ACC=CAM_ASM_000260 /TAXON_ID=95228 /ORGANISM="Vannella robusta, Strain DIVA3 518/3/11/1/6" /LENGTH=129 /DNA_ID=CAMNT_0053605159 /DNA_START=40 /DNA_END=429 /DNA_ORIENTATION=+